MAFSIELSVFSCLDDRNNMSIPVLTRLWKHSTTAMDATLLSGVISELLNPRSPAGLQYRAIHPMQSEAFGLISMSFNDINTEFFSIFVSRMLWLSIQDLPPHMELLLDIYHVGRSSHDQTYAAFINTASLCHTLWSNSFSLLRLIAQRGPRFDNNCYRISQAIIGNAAFCINSVKGKSHQCRQLVQHWAVSDFFGALDDILPIALYSSYFSGRCPGFCPHISLTSMCSSIRACPIRITSNSARPSRFHALSPVQTIPALPHDTCSRKLGTTHQYHSTYCIPRISVGDVDIFGGFM